MSWVPKPVREEPAAASEIVEEDDDRWARLLPELVTEVVRRLESGAGERWPARKDVVSCACVCRRWRSAALALVRPPADSGKITFPSSLKQPGPRDSPMQCFIKRNKKNETFHLYLSLGHGNSKFSSTVMDKGKFLMAAKRFRRGSHTEYIISLDADDLSQGSNAYVGKLRSDFLGTSFRIYDSQPPYDGAKMSSSRSSRRFGSRRISPQVTAGNFEVGQVSYKYNLLKSRGPRRMHCALQLQCPPAQEVMKEDGSKAKPEIVLKNKSPRWHEHLQCWCLNFHGRVTIASVKNFQLTAAAEPTAADEPVLLQFGKVGPGARHFHHGLQESAFGISGICHLPDQLWYKACM